MRRGLLSLVLLLLVALPATASESVSFPSGVGASQQVSPSNADDAPAYRILITSPAVSRHSGKQFYEDYHPGLGLDIQVSPDKESPWNVAFGGYNMDRDSYGHPMWWAGVTTSYTLGDRAGWWIEPGIFAGLMHKRGLYDEAGPLALPEIAAGCGPLGAVFAYIPATPLTNNVSIGLFMLRLRADWQ